MEVHFSPDTEARLQQLATRTGKDTAKVVEEAVDRVFEYDIHFLEAVEEGHAAARRGELLDHDAVVKASNRSSSRDARPLDHAGRD